MLERVGRVVARICTAGLSDFAEDAIRGQGDTARFGIQLRPGSLGSGDVYRIMKANNIKVWGVNTTWSGILMFNVKGEDKQRALDALAAEKHIPEYSPRDEAGY